MSMGLAIGGDPPTALLAPVTEAAVAADEDEENFRSAKLRGALRQKSRATPATAGAEINILFLTTLLSALVLDVHFKEFHFSMKVILSPNLFIPRSRKSWTDLAQAWLSFPKIKEEVNSSVPVLSR